MITDNGKDIIAKFLVGQIPAFATHIAVGCGSKPLKNNDTLDVGNAQTKNVLDFEMARAQIISQGFVDQNYIYAITNKVKLNNIATLTIGNHVLSTGDTITVDLTTTDANFEGSFRVSSVTSTTISYYFAGNNVASVSTTGTLTATKTKISLTAALPSENRYEITEVGLWSAGNNILATGTDSRLLSSFTESWQGHSTSVFSPPFKESIGDASAINQSNVPDKVFYVATGNPVLHTADRRERKEGPRFLNSTILVRGDSCNLQGSPGSLAASDVVNNVQFKSLNNNFATLKTDVVAGVNVGDIITVAGVDSTFNGTYTVISVDPIAKSITYVKQASDVTETASSGTISTTSTHIHLNNFNFNIGENNPSDELVLALSVVDKDSLGNGVPDSVKILMEFYRNEVAVVQTGVARKEIIISSSDLINSRYQTVRFKISELTTDDNFNASDISVCRIFTTVIKSGNPSPDHYISYDGFRIDNVSTENPVYKLSGYSVIQNVNGYPIIKLPNSNNYLEFRLSLGIT
jgi:hypothetical protein